MAVISRGSIRTRINNLVTLAAEDDLDGVQDATKNLTVTGSERVLIFQTPSASTHILATGDFTGGANDDMFTASAHGLVDGDYVRLVYESAAGVVTGDVGDTFIVNELSSSTFQLTTDGTTVVENSADGTAVFQVIGGSAGQDVIQVSHDGGNEWQADDLLLPLAQDDLTGTLVTSGALNASGTPPTSVAVFKGGPYPGPTIIRCARDTSGFGGEDWVGAAPLVQALIIGGEPS